MTMPTRRRWVEVEEMEDVSLVRFTTARMVNEQDIHLIGEQLYALLTRPGPPKLVVSFGGVEQLSSAMVGKLIALDRKVRVAGGRLAFCNIEPNIYDIFQVAGLKRVFNIYDSEAEALQSF